jgi:hypothetical protein
MPRPDDILKAEDYERQIRREAQQVSIDHNFRSKLLLENTVEAFATWLVTYFPHRIATIEDWQIEPLECMVLEERTLILVPAGTMKTTIGSELEPIWRLCQSADYEIRGFFKNDDEGKKSLGSVKREMRFNEKLIADYGPFFVPGKSGRLYKWNEHEVEVCGRKRRSKEPSLAYYPYGGQGKALGGRFHRGFFDDIVTRELAASSDQVNKSMEWLAIDFETGPYPPDSDVDWIDSNGYRFMEQIRGMGTRMTPKDTYARIEERNKTGDSDNPHFRPYRTVCIDIVKDWDRQETISARWPWQKLMAKKDELKEPAFSMRMRNIALNPETMVFKEAWIRGGEHNNITYPGCRDTARTLRTAPEGAIGAIGYDPQSGKKTRYTKEAAVVGLVTVPSPTGHLHPLLFDWWAGRTPIIERGNKESQLYRVVEMARQMNEQGIRWPVIRLEDNNVQAGLYHPLVDLAAELGVSMTVDTPPTGKNKEDESTGIEACAGDFQNGWGSIPYKTVEDQERALVFEQHMIEYGTSDYFDVPMAYWMAHVYLYEQRFSRRVQEAVLTRRLPRYMQRYYGARGNTIRIVNAHAPVMRDDGRLE